MPVAEETKSSWADEIEEEGRGVILPSPTEVLENDLKIVTEYKYENEKKYKVVRTFKMERMVVPKSIALRKTWKKFGMSKDDKPGPNPSTTVVCEDVYMQFISSKEEDNKPDEDALEKLKVLGDKVVKCRTCSGEHWTTKCPYKDTVLGGKLDEKKPELGLGDPTKAKPGAPSGGTKYVPPNLRDGAASKGLRDTGNPRARDDTVAIRISNLSESTTESDLEELVKPFGPISKLYLAKDKTFGLCKGFAYIHFKTRHDAARAIANLNGHGYDHLILIVDWSKPPQNNDNYKN